MPTSMPTSVIMVCVGRFTFMLPHAAPLMPVPLMPVPRFNHDCNRWCNVYSRRFHHAP